MIHIEITGIPGSGKSFLIKELDEYLNQNGYRTYTNKTLIILYMKNISKTIKITSKFLPQKISNYIAYKLFVNHRERIIKKTIENKQFYQSLIKIVNSKVLDIVLRKSISKWIFNSIVYKSIADEYLSSEILIKPVEKNDLESEIEKLKNKIKIEGFENIARKLSISESSVNGGDLGWLDENVISKKIKSAIINTPVGALSEPILLPEGILIFKIKDKRKIKNTQSLEEIKNKLVNAEKLKILNMYSLSHYDKLRRSFSVKFFQ